MNTDEDKPKPSEHSNDENSTSRFEATDKDIDFMLSMTRQERAERSERIRARQKAHLEDMKSKAAAKKASNQSNPSEHSNDENSTSRFEVSKEDIALMLSRTPEETRAIIEESRARQAVYIEQLKREVAAKKASNQGWRRIINLIRKFINRK